MSDADSSKSPIREVVGVDAPLNGFWPSRPADFRGQPRRCPPNSRSITVALLPPSVPALDPKVTLDTRQDKHISRSYAEQRGHPVELGPG